ncbi:hypothetical protein AMTR_s00094p00145370 [Amborella trichopoda]|uniref:Uncharacterized protein n=1 Tax=Amborella trichopoda TaxID=13333 RepID=W1NP82_AMBTC|nr:hypothetical protein AMTR_s00094p00145370 [Amborella trichopoda]
MPTTTPSPCGSSSVSSSSQSSTTHTSPHLSFLCLTNCSHQLLHPKFRHLLSLILPSRSAYSQSANYQCHPSPVTPTIVLLSLSNSLPEIASGHLRSSLLSVPLLSLLLLPFFPPLPPLSSHLWPSTNPSVAAFFFLNHPIFTSVVLSPTFLNLDLRHPPCSSPHRTIPCQQLTAPLFPFFSHQKLCCCLLPWDPCSGAFPRQL